MTELLSFDLCIIGAGAAGLSVAAGASQLGVRVALIEKGDMGGDCLNTGCVPSKSILAAAKTVQTIQNAGLLGIKTPEPDIDFAAVHHHITNVISQIAPHDSQERFENMGVTVIREAAEFISEKEIKTKTYNITAKSYVIAAGSSPFIPPVKGLEENKILTNETIFELKELPEHLIIIGGGPIGVEMAQAHKRLGSKVTLIDIETILPKDDPDLVTILCTALKKEGVQILEKTNIEEVQHNKDNVEVHVKTGDNKNIIMGSHILVAAGRSPNTDNLGLDKAGIAYNKKGIIVDKRLRTSKKHIYAAGDITGGPQFTHIAGYHAGIIIRNLLFKLPAKTDYKALPWVTYTDPELAQVGLTEKTAREKYGEKIKVLRQKFADNDRARTDNQKAGCIKVILAKNGRILGASIAGPHAGELISLWGLAISQNLKIGAIANMIMPYPTYGEISKHVAGSYYTPSLFSDKTKKLVKLLQKLPF